MAFRKRSVNNVSDDMGASVSTGIGGINKAISEEEGKIEKQYLRIGKLYASAHKEDFEEIYADPMRAIAAAESNIAAYRTQMQVLKGVALCPKCGNEAPGGSAFCNRCGTKIPPLDMSKFVNCPICGKPVVKELSSCVFCGRSMTAQEIQPNRCVKCGAPLEKGARFCRSCGTPVKAPATLSKEDVEVPSKRVCPRCGTSLPDDVRFCTECGHKL